MIKNSAAKKMASLSPALQRALKIFFVLCVLVSLLDLIILGYIGTNQTHHWWRFFGFHSLYGFVACVILVVVATAMRRLIMRDEDYYD